MMKKLLVLLMSLGMLVFVGNVNATVLTFDDLPDIVPNLGDEPIYPISSFFHPTYGGLTWSSSFYYADPAELNAFYGILDSGYSNGLVSSNHIAYNSGASSVVVSDGLFDFNGAYLTGAWNDDLNIRVQGYSGGTKIYDTTVVVDSTAHTWFDFNYMDIDYLAFTSFGGTYHGYGFTGQQFVMDNFTFNEVSVPEPSTLFLLGFGFAGVGLLRRRFKS
jgi:hypothetical protein